MEISNYYLNETKELLKETGKQWYKNNPFRNAAVISYYAIFSLPGLFIIVVNLAGNFYGTEAITNQLSSQIANVVGSQAANQIETIIANAHVSGDYIWATVISFAVILYAATGVFYHIQKSLDNIWGLRTNPDRRIKSYLKDRLFSFVMILIVGLLMIASLITSSIMAGLAGTLNSFMTNLLSIAGLVISFLIITGLFAAIFKVLPDLNIAWKNVWPGALLTSVLFFIANFLLRLFLGYAHPGSTYGAAGSIIVIMLWVTYSGIILLFGAVFTKVYTLRYGGNVKANSYAVFLDEEKNRK